MQISKLRQERNIPLLTELGVLRVANFYKDAAPTALGRFQENCGRQLRAGLKARNKIAQGKRSAALG